MRREAGGVGAQVSVAAAGALSEVRRSSGLGDEPRILMKRAAPHALEYELRGGSRARFYRACVPGHVRGQSRGLIRGFSEFTDSTETSSAGWLSRWVDIGKQPTRRVPDG
jgi:hypothetical protein